MPVDAGVTYTVIAVGTDDACNVGAVEFQTLVTLCQTQDQKAVEQFCQKGKKE